MTEFKSARSRYLYDEIGQGHDHVSLEASSRLSTDEGNSDPEAESDLSEIPDEFCVPLTTDMSGDDATVELSSDWGEDETDRDDNDHRATLTAPLKLRCLFLVCCCILPLFFVFALMIAASAHAFG